MTTTATRLVVLFIGLLVFIAVPCRAAEPAWQGQPVQAALEALRESGLNLIYSTDLVTPDLIIVSEPQAPGPLDRAREILEPHGLEVESISGRYVVVRIPAPPPDPVPPGPGAPGPGAGVDAVFELEEITVFASRYILFSNSQFFIDQRAIQALPDLGEDPVRSSQRLPGVAAGGLSARSHFRGGENNENGIYLNGLKLLDPFHIRDYHNIFSSIDARAISGMEAYTGGFPANYGDHMSGVLALESMKPEERLHTELGLSAYNLSVLNSGYTDNRRVDWLVSARRSTLDIILDDDLGEPDYFDVFAELGLEVADGHHLTINALYSDDEVVVITESDPEELEQSNSDTRNSHFWVSLDSDWSAALNSRTTISYSRLENLKVAVVNDPERMVAFARDEREADILAVQQDWIWSGPAGHTLRWGLAARSEHAEFDYRGAAEYNGFFEYYPGIENPVERAVKAAPDGYSYSLFLSDRWQFSERSGLELGLRWDKQTYTDPEYDGQLSPRISFLHRFGSSTELRFSWGRYRQSHAIHELQVEDGLDRYFAPQRSDHWIAGVQHRFGNGYRLRSEAFYKDYGRLRPRFENLFDPLAMIPELAPDRVALIPDSARAYGIETTFEFRGGEELDWWANYTWSKAEDRFDGVEQPRSWDQRHALQAGLAWERGPWEIGIALSLHSGWPITGMDYAVLPGEPEEDEEEPEDVYVPVPGRRNGEDLDYYAQIDFRVSRTFDVKRGRLTAFFEVTNLFNRDNPCCVDYDIDEDDDGNVFFDRSEEDWLPIIPAAGLLWEF